MREINREIGLDDALKNMGIGNSRDERSDSEGDEKSRSPEKREVEEIETPA